LTDDLLSDRELGRQISGVVRDSGVSWDIDLSGILESFRLKLKHILSF